MLTEEGCDDWRTNLIIIFCFFEILSFSLYSYININNIIEI